MSNKFLQFASIAQVGKDRFDSYDHIKDLPLMTLALLLGRFRLTNYSVHNDPYLVGFFSASFMSSTVELDLSFCNYVGSLPQSRSDFKSAKPSIRTLIIEHLTSFDICANS